MSSGIIAFTAVLAIALLFGFSATERLPWPWGYIAFFIIGIAGSALAAAAYVRMAVRDTDCEPPEGPPPG